MAKARTGESRDASIIIRDSDDEDGPHVIDLRGDDSDLSQSTPEVYAIKYSASSKQDNSNHRSPNSQSPLAFRANCNKSPQRAMGKSPDLSTERGGLGTESSITSMIDILGGYLTEMKENQALFTRFLLQETRQSAKRVSTSHLDLRSGSNLPNMPPIHGLTSNSQSSIKINFLGKKGPSKSAIVPFKCITSVEARIPGYRHYIPITKSFLVGDNDRLDFTPYLGDTDPYNPMITRQLQEAYGEKTKDPLASRKVEQASRLNEHLTRMLDLIGLSNDEVLTVLFHSRPSKAPTKAARFIDAFEKTFDIPFRSLISDSDRRRFDIKRQHSSSQSSMTDSSPSKLLETYVDLGCLICGVHECNRHGDFEDGTRNLSMAFKDILTLRAERIARSSTDEGLPLASLQHYKEDEYCSQKCFMNPENESLENCVWSTKDQARLRVLLLPTTDLNSRRVSCVVAPHLLKPCYQVHQQLPVNEPFLSTPKSRVRRETKHLTWYDKSRRMLTTDDFGKVTKTHLHHERKQPRGCSHKGQSCAEARLHCSCVRQNVLCEKFCACPDDCHLRFLGCACVNGCRSDSCACKSLNRECDPDFCTTCGIIESAKQPNRHEDLPAGSCQNCSLQLGAGKKVIVGESSLGTIYGLYMAEPVRRDKFIAEYVGEIISSEEANRRGIVYDAIKLSYLFDLNKDCTIDAAKYGNETRFVNHSLRDPNCKPIVKLVGEEHRIGFYALRDIDAGEELFFDYGKDFAAKYGLIERGQSARGRGRGRGGRSGRGRIDRTVTAKSTLNNHEDVEMAEAGVGTDSEGDASSVAEQVDSEHEEEDEEDLMEEGDDEDGGDDEDRQGVQHINRPRRSIAKVKKYTR